MVEPRQSAMQRIQVGVIGLVVVLLFVSLANMVLDRVAAGVPADNDAGVPVAEPEMADEPLAELGVTPVATEEDDPAVGPAQSSGSRNGQTGQRR